MPEPKTTFKIFAPLLKTSIGPDGNKRLHGVASSTITDRHGDDMSVTALSDMERSAQQNMTIFLNHSYNVPEDVAGSVERASLSRSAQDPDIHDLSLDIVVNKANERAVKAWEAIDGGTKLGLSIGAMIPDGGATRKDNGAYTINHVELLETSLVGVPANPRSWVEYAVKALDGYAQGTETRIVDGEVTVTDFGLGTVEETKDVGLRQEDSDKLDAALEDGICNGCGGDKKRPKKGCKSAWHEHEEAEKSVDGEDEGMPTFEGSPAEDIPEVEIASTAASAALTIEAPEPPQPEADLDPEAVTDGAEPDKTDATVSVETEHAKITVDTGNRGKTPDGASQEAQASVPENEEKADSPWDAIGLTGAPEEDDIRSALQMLEPTVTASLRNSTQLLAALTSELVEARKDREEAIKDAADALTLAKDVLDRVAATPAGRRAVVPEGQQQLAAKASSLTAVYGSEFVEALRKDT
jgi:phage head maturation protease